MVLASKWIIGEQRLAEGFGQCTNTGCLTHLWNTGRLRIFLDPLLRRRANPRTYTNHLKWAPTIRWAVYTQRDWRNFPFNGIGTLTIGHNCGLHITTPKNAGGNTSNLGTQSVWEANSYANARGLSCPRIWDTEDSHSNSIGPQIVFHFGAFYTHIKSSARELFQQGDKNRFTYIKTQEVTPTISLEQAIVSKSNIWGAYAETAYQGGAIHTYPSKGLPQINRPTRGGSLHHP